jgi:tetratricopeptide (TPR) repeat protein
LVSALSANVGDGRADMPEVWGRIPQRNKNFTGREGILETLREALASDVTAVVPTALQGFGGVGKTQVAIEYAWRYAHEYDLVWWISADQPVLVRSSLAALAPHLRLPSPTAAGIEDAATAVLESLRRGQPFKRWLLIFDNADLPEDIADIIPRGRFGHVLITSRNPRWNAVVKTLPVDVFSRKESIEFLTRRVPRGVSEDEADRLAEELGDLPLALEQAAALQAETGMSIDEYLRLLREHATQLLAEGKPTEYPVSMTAAWSISVAQLKQKLPEAIELLRCCAFFGPEPIPRDVFVPLADAEQNETPGTDPHHRLLIHPQLYKLLADPILLSTAIRELGRYALARIDAASRTIQVHRLVQALVRDELNPEEQARMRHVVHVLLANAAPKSPDVRLNWSRYNDLLGHAEPSHVVECPNPVVRQFCLDVVRYLYASGDMTAAHSFVELVISAWERDPREESDLYVLFARRHLGNILRELGDYRAAFDINQATLERMIQVLGPDDEQTLLLTTSYGADLRARGEFEQARHHDEDSLRRHESVFGVSDRRTLRAANNLALDYVLTSDYERARQLHMETYQRQRSPGSGVSAQEILSSWNGLARIVRLSGNYSEAVDLGEDAHAFGVGELGAEHPWTLRTAKDLSIARRMSGATDDGLELAEETFARARRIFGADNPDTLAAAMNLANARRMAGRVEEGFELAMDTMDRYPKIYGRDHPYNYGCAVNLALLRRDRGDTEQARELDEASLAKLDASLGRKHHFTLMGALNLASDLALLGETRAARELDEGSLVLLKELLGEDHPLTLACAANLAHDLRADGDSEHAAEVFADTMSRYDAVLGLEHPDTKAVREYRRLDFDFDPPPI